jgi:aldose 1-epimerase
LRNYLFISIYVATTDAPTIINLTQHAYFNLKGYAGGSILDTELMIDADTYLATDCNLLPTGEIKAVEGTPFDFRAPKAIGRDINEKNDDLLKATNVFNGYDHCFNFSNVTRESVKRAEAYDAKSGRVMEMYTNQPCVQIYTANFMKNPKFPFKGGLPQRVQHAVCLETQRMPDSMNHEGFTNCILNPGETYTELLADASAYEDFDAEPYFNGRGFGFVKLQQLMLEHLMGARG